MIFTLLEVIKEIQQEEQGHQEAGADLAGKGNFVSAFVAQIAQWGAYTAKYAASKL